MEGKEFSACGRKWSFLPVEKGNSDKREIAKLVEMLSRNEVKVIGVLVK